MSTTRSLLIQLIIDFASRRPMMINALNASSAFVSNKGSWPIYIYSGNVTKLVIEAAMVEKLTLEELLSIRQLLWSTTVDVSTLMPIVLNAFNFRRRSCI